MFTRKKISSDTLGVISVRWYSTKMRLCGKPAASDQLDFTYASVASSITNILGYVTQGVRAQTIRRIVDLSKFDY